MSTLDRLALPVVCLCMLCVCLTGSPAKAQAVSQAELALTRGAYSEAHDLMQTAIQSGRATAEDLSEPYRILALSTAHLDDAEAATRAFIALLAFKPSYRLPDGLPAEVRSPYMNARGFWSLHTERLSVTAQLGPTQMSLILHIVDPAQLSARVRLRMRARGIDKYFETVRVPSSELEIPLAGLTGAAELEYSLALLDEHGNRIWQGGSDAEPLRLTRPSQAEVVHNSDLDQAPRRPSGAAPLPRPSSDSRNRPAVLSGSSLLVLGALAALGGGYTHFRHEELARRWNSGNCQGTGTTRGMICASENREMNNMQLAATALYGAGAAALLTGTLVLLLTRRSPRERVPDSASVDLTCSHGPGAFGLACSRRF